jgi:pimeloyl-[acyl-carrier protein] methyl ester esterase
VKADAPSQSPVTLHTERVPRAAATPAAAAASAPAGIRAPALPTQAGALPLVLLHGWGLNLRVWDGVRDRLAAHRDVIVVDLPGHGRSAFDPVRATLAQQSELLREVLPAQCVLLGWSLGGQFALQLAAHAPAQVRSLVLVATNPRFVAAPDWPQGMAPAVLATFAAHLEHDYRRTVGEFLELQVRGSRDADCALATLRRALLEHGEAQPGALAADLEILRSADARPLLPSIRQPVLVIAGQYDRVTPPASGRALASALPRAAYVELRRSAHAPFLSHADQFVASIRGFLENAP